MSEKPFLRKIYHLTLGKVLGKLIMYRLKSKVRPDIEALYDGNEFSTGTFEIIELKRVIKVFVINFEGDILVLARNEAEGATSDSLGSRYEEFDKNVDDISKAAAYAVFDVWSKLD